jgi:hypothetical protein
MKKLILLAALCSILVYPFSSGAQTVGASDPPDKAEVLRFLDLMHAKAQMVQVLQGMTAQMRLGAEQGFKQKVPDAMPEQLAKVDHLFDDIFATIPIDQMIDAIVPIYQRHFTKADLAAVTAFYSSPAGQKILTEMPAIMSESMQAGGEVGRQAFSAQQRKFDQSLADLEREPRKSP